MCVAWCGIGPGFSASQVSTIGLLSMTAVWNRYPEDFRPKVQICSFIVRSRNRNWFLRQLLLNTYYPEYIVQKSKLSYSFLSVRGPQQAVVLESSAYVLLLYNRVEQNLHGTSGPLVPYCTRAPRLPNYDRLNEDRIVTGVFLHHDLS
jgi:hypothetical protein